MFRTCAAIGVLLISALAAPAGAKDEEWTQICGRSGCKNVTERLVAAALTSEAEEQGSTIRTSLLAPAYTVRYVAPDSGEPFGPTYWLTAREIDFTIRSSQASVSRLFVDAKAGVQPFRAAGLNRTSSWDHSLALGSTVVVMLLVGALLYFRHEARATTAPP
jgi:hypothetical protein